MKKSFFIIVVILIGCSKTETKIPPDVLTRDEMVNVLIDVHLLEAKITKLYLNPDSSSKVYNHYEKLLFSDLGITQEKYKKSMAFYVNEIGELRAIYNRVTDSLLVRQKALSIE